jgi:hypothetical protein
MKTLTRLGVVMALMLITFFCPGQTAEQAPEKPVPPSFGSLDYWQEKIQEKNISFFELKNEFHDYWKDKTPVKGSGYKQISRWLTHKEAYANPDGTLRLPEDDLQQALEIMQHTNSMTISGNWSYAGPFQPIHYVNENTTTTAAMGRVTTIGFNPHDNNTIYVGAPLGGLWRSTNYGDSWENMNTDIITSLGVSAVAVHPTDPNTIFIGTGDRDNENTLGQGIYKSTDGGLTWEAKPLTTRHDKIVHKIYFNPTNPNIMAVASNYGIFYSVDGGETWQKRLIAYIIDMEQKPGEPLTLYAVSKTTFYKSTDFGYNWTAQLTQTTHRMAIGVTAANPERVLLFTTKDSKFHRVYRSSNSGETFETIYSTGITPGDKQGGYNLDVIIDPNNQDIVYAGMINFYKSTDGGVTFVNQEPVYADDQHIFEFHPVTHRLYIGNDSGIWYTDNGTDYCYSSNGLNITSSYRIDVSAQNPNRIISGNQDAATFITLNSTTHKVCGGDGMTCRFDHTDENYIYTSSQEGNVRRATNGGVIDSLYKTIASNGVNGITQKGNWQTPYVISYFNPNMMFYGAHDVYWSGNVKTANPDIVTFFQISDNIAGTDMSTTIEYMKQSRAQESLLYIAYNNGRMFRTSNALDYSPVWVELEQPNNMGGVRFETHPTNPNIVYIVKGINIYRSINRGNSWQDITGNLTDLGKLSIAYMNGSPEGLYVGTTAGVYYKDTTMTDWVPFKTGLPLTQVRDMVINYSTTPAQLFAGTFGRGIWKTTVLPSYVPDIYCGTENTTTINGTYVNSYNQYHTSQSMVTIDHFSYGYYLSENNVISTNDNLLLQTGVSNIAPGMSQLAQLATDVAAALPELAPGTYYLGLLIDNQEEVDETNETNNEWVASTQVVIPANPATPVNVQASDGDYPDKVTITWENNTGEPLYFAVFRAESLFDLAPDQISPAWTTSLAYDDYSAVPGQTYYYRVKASRYPAGIRPSAQSSYNIGHTALVTPANVEASDGSFSDRIVITWTPVVGATHYKIYRSLTPVATEQNVITGLTWVELDSSYTDYGPAYGNTYYYWVRAAMNEFGQYSTDFSAANTGYLGFVTAPTATASDGTYTDRVEVTWNTVPGATHYRVYRGTYSHPVLSDPVSGWQTPTSFSDLTAGTAIKYYYWIKASQDAAGTITTGYGAKDAGYRNFVPPPVTATDGTSTYYTSVSWTAVSGATYYKVYRRNSTTDPYIPVSGWITRTSRSDATGVPGALYQYSIRVASDTNYIVSNYAAYDAGYRRIAAPVVSTTIGAQADRVTIIWQPAEGASHYRVQRATVENPVYTTLVNYSNTLNNYFTDLTAVPNQRYYYRVTGAVNSSGLRAGNNGLVIGMAGACSNLEEEDSTLRTFNLHGTTIDIGMRLANWGYYNLADSVSITVYLESSPPDGTPEVTLGTTKIPPLEVDEFFDATFSADAGNIPGFDFTYGTWHIALGLNCDNGNGNCDNTTANDYVLWYDPVVNHTDALHGIYTIGSAECDFVSPAAALDALLTRGMSDPVTFHLMPEEFIGQLYFTHINGSGPEKGILFTRHPDHADTATIVAVPTKTSNYTIRLENCTNLTFDGLHLKSLGSSDFENTYGRVIHLGNGCSQLSFINNFFEGFTDDAHYGLENAVIYASYFSGSDLLFENNRICNGMTGINIQGANLNTGPVNNLLIRNNEITGYRYIGIDLRFIDHLEITGNFLSNNPLSTQWANGIAFADIINGADISNNRIQLTGNAEVKYGIQLFDCNMEASQPMLISNNFITLESGSFINFGAYLGVTTHLLFVHNSINIYGPPGNISSLLGFQGADTPQEYTNTILNNNLVNQSGGICVTYNNFLENPGFITEMNYNNLVTDGPVMFTVDQAPYPDMASWRSLTGLDMNSVSSDPGFVSNTDLHCTSLAFDNLGTPVPAVVLDIDGDPRSPATPDIGADEFSNDPAEKTLTLEVFLEGLYNGSNTMRQAFDENGPHFGAGIADQIVIELHNASGYGNIAYTSPPVNLGTNGQAVITVPGTFSGSYYITIRHRNSLVTTTAAPVSFSASNVELNLDHPTKAFGDNLLMMIDGKYVIYGGDVNQDGSVDTADMTPVDNDASAFATGYLTTDVNGDGTIDTGDMTIIDNNAAAFVSSITP